MRKLVVVVPAGFAVVFAVMFGVFFFKTMGELRRSGEELEKLEQARLDAEAESARLAAEAEAEKGPDDGKGMAEWMAGRFEEHFAEDGGAKNGGGPGKVEEAGDPGDSAEDIIEEIHELTEDIKYRRAEIDEMMAEMERLRQGDRSEATRAQIRDLKERLRKVKEAADHLAAEDLERRLLQARRDMANIATLWDAYPRHAADGGKTEAEIIESLYGFGPRDPWKNRYLIVFDADTDGLKITSYGADGAKGGAGADADIVKTGAEALAEKPADEE